MISFNLFWILCMCLLRSLPPAARDKHKPHLLIPTYVGKILFREAQAVLLEREKKQVAFPTTVPQEHRRHRGSTYLYRNLVVILLVGACLVLCAFVELISCSMVGSSVICFEIETWSHYARKTASLIGFSAAASSKPFSLASSSSSACK